mgnify:CR=1 FL=1
MSRVRIVRGKRRRRRSERAQFRDTLRSSAKSFIGGFESPSGKRFVEAMTDEARRNGRPLGGAHPLSAEVIAELRRLGENARRSRQQNGRPA